MDNLNIEDIEDENDLWRWYTQEYLTNIIEPPSGLTLIVDKLKESDLPKIINNVLKILMPKKMQIDTNNNSEQATDTSNAPASTSKEPASTSKEPVSTSKAPASTNTPKQQGGSYCNYSLFNQPENLGPYYVYRLEAYNELMAFLSEKNIKISLLTKQFLKKLYLHHYTIEYIKALNYILSKIKIFTFSPKLIYIVTSLFNKMSNKIYDGVCK